MKTDLFLTDFLDLLAEWDYSKNDVDPASVKPFSNIKRWWICSKGHSWFTAPQYRSKGHGCPYCSGRKAIPGENDLATTHPEIAAEWDYERNSFSPESVKAGCNKKAWWICPKGHTYDAVIENRALFGHGCPYCSGKRVLSGFNDLSTMFPVIAAEWDYEKNAPLTPDAIQAHSGRRVWWKCSLGHSWPAAISNRTYREGSCPFCARKRPHVKPGFNDLATTNPEILSLWDFEKNAPLSPEQLRAGSPRIVWWKCSLGHSWENSIYHITHGGKCPYCSGYRALAGFNDFATLYPHLAAEWDHDRNTDTAPDSIHPGSKIKVWWLCPKGHSYQAAVSNRVRNGSGCPYCCNRKVLSGYNDLATIDPDLASEWDYEHNGNLKPSDVTFGSMRKVWWKCPNGHHYQAVISRRSKFAVRSSGCPYCHHKLPVPGETDLTAKFPELANQWDYEKNYPNRPEHMLPGSGKYVWWLCDKGHSWKARISARTGEDEGCPYCTNQKIWSGHNDMATLYPSLVPEWDISKNGAVTPSDVGVNAGYIAWWICSKGHSWSCSVMDRCLGRECPVCSKSGGYTSRLI